MGAQIIDRGRGPEIAGTRITVYDVVDYLQEGWRYDQIAGLFSSSPDDIQAAIQYIKAREEDVMGAYRQILERHRNVQYSPEVQEKLVRNRRKLEDKLAEIRARQQAEGTHVSRSWRIMILQDRCNSCCTCSCLLNGTPSGPNLRCASSPLRV